MGRRLPGHAASEAISAINKDMWWGDDGNSTEGTKSSKLSTSLSSEARSEIWAAQREMWSAYAAVTAGLDKKRVSTSALASASAVE
jgi:hypothetical protein